MLVEFEAEFPLHGVELRFELSDGGESVPRIYWN